MPASPLANTEVSFLLFELEKRFNSTRGIVGPMDGESKTYKLDSDNGAAFLLDIYRKYNVVARATLSYQPITFQNRYNSNIVLARLDFVHTTHRNPDGFEISGPHLHLYVEGFESRWAYPIEQADLDRFMSTRPFLPHPYGNGTARPKNPAWYSGGGINNWDPFAHLINLTNPNILRWPLF